VNIFEAARKEGVKGICYASSLAVMGKDSCYAEKHVADNVPLLPDTLYGVYKVANESAANVCWQDWQVGSIGLRPYCVYGVARDQGMTADIAKAILATAIGKPYHIRFGGKAGAMMLINGTQITETHDADQVLGLLNDYFEFIAAAVTARGGEILRFIGATILIVFPIDDKQDKRAACQAAIDAAIDAQNTLASLNHRRRRQGQEAIEFGLGLNVGEVIYGNVGAPDRLDFTVMGPAVNRTARLESLTKETGRNILFSKEFADLIDEPVQSLGKHNMKGIDKPQAVFALESE